MTDPAGQYPRVYVGKARPQWKGRRCRIIGTWGGHAPHNVLLQFDDGTYTICPIRCVRRVKP